jgi:hypothetical protein
VLKIDALAIIQSVLIIGALVGLRCTGFVRTLPPADKPIFDQSRVNFAWGFQCSGMYIDGRGRVYKYVCDKPDSTNPEFQTRIIDRQAVDKRFYINDTLMCVVDSSRLVDIYQLLLLADREPVHRSHRGFDMGGRGITGFLYSDTSVVPKEIPLSGSGDWSLRREGPASDEILEWVEASFGKAYNSPRGRR